MSLALIVDASQTASPATSTSFIQLPFVQEPLSHCCHDVRALVFNIAKTAICYMPS